MIYYQERPYWSKHDAARAWGVSANWVQRIIHRAEGAIKLIVDGRATWAVPAGAAKPTMDRERKADSP